ncbi:efflux RND transporter periplasmic adaptor subunit [Dehalococcoidia bacterium]|nr:efflux RND transporter periplasmic adaptor subunit [Dehalococcoidia bacterium]
MQNEPKPGRLLKLWQIVILVVILIGAAGISYIGYFHFSSSSEETLNDNQQLIPVQYGDLVNEVSTSGGLLFPNRTALTFGSSGIVGEVLVEEGQSVKIGQILAKLDSATVTSLEKKVAQTRVNLRDAEEGMDAINSTDDTLLASLGEKIAQAQVNLQNAQDNLNSTEEISNDIEAAQSKVDTSDVSLSDAKTSLSLVSKLWNERQQEAVETTNTLRDTYKNLFRKYLGIEPTNEQVAQEPQALLKSLGADLNVLFDPKTRFEFTSPGVYTWTAPGPPEDDPITSWNEVVVYSWMNLFPGTLIESCDDGHVAPISPQRPIVQDVCVTAQMQDSWDILRSALDNQETVDLEAMNAVNKAESTLDRAQDTLSAAQDTLSQLMNGADPLLVALAEAKVTSAEAAIDAAREKLSEQQEGPDPALVALAKAELIASQAALATAIQSLEDSTIKASSDGVVSLLSIEVGQEVKALASVIEVVDRTVVEVDGVVDEIDVLFVQEGAQASVTMDALPGQELDGTVSSIASAARSQQGVVSYPIRIRIQIPQGLELREGLSATASIIIREERNVLLIPLQALHGRFEQPVVLIMRNERVEERPVILGNSDDFWTVVRQGLVEGDQVIIEATQADTNQMGLRNTFRALSGGGSGGGRRP